MIFIKYIPYIPEPAKSFAVTVTSFLLAQSLFTDTSVITGDCLSIFTGDTPKPVVSPFITSALYVALLTTLTFVVIVEFVPLAPVVLLHLIDVSSDVSNISLLPTSFLTPIVILSLNHVVFKSSVVHLFSSTLHNV